MGGTTWSAASYQASAQTKQNYTQAQAMPSRTIDPEMDPKGVVLREARDSDAHPNSVAIIVALDVTGSMGAVPEQLIKGKLTEIMETVIAHGIPDPQIMFVAVGDHYTDNFPFQIGQFESGDVELEKWLTKICNEGKGGGNGGESYGLTWFFAGQHTSIDCFEKRGQKGFLFTIGDEDVHPVMQAQALKTIFGKGESEVKASDALSAAQRQYHVFHICVNQCYEPAHLRHMLGERMLEIGDPELVAEVIGSTVAVVNGADITKVVSGFSSSVAGKVTTALANVKAEVATTGSRSSTL